MREIVRNDLNEWSKPDGRVRWRQGGEASDLNRKSRKSSASLDVECPPELRHRKDAHC
jgi:hypothetical protein